jgi:hypothetical protein
VQEAREEGWDDQGQPQGQVRLEQVHEQHDEQRGRPYQRPEMRTVMADTIEAVMINMYEKPETRNVMDDNTDAVMLKHEVRGWRQDPLRKGSQHVREDQDEGWDAQDRYLDCLVFLLCFLYYSYLLEPLHLFPLLCCLLFIFLPYIPFIL